MRFPPCGLLAVLPAFCLLCAQASWPAQSTSRHPVYAATEPDLNELPADGEVVSAPPTEVVSAPRSSKAPAPSYDPVPPEQVDSLANRLRLTLEILEKSHRAYDYRLNTTHELQTILSQLDPPPSR